MRSFLFILLLSFFPPLQCQDYNDKSNHFFVTRRDNKEAICIEPTRGSSSSSFPTFDLDKLQIPPSGFKHWDWLSKWQLQNDTNMRRRGESKVLIAGNLPFYFVAPGYDGATVIFLASNISLWMAHEDRPGGAGMLFEVDHFNEKTKLKDTTLKYCDQNPEVEGANCIIVDSENGTNLLNDGNHWTTFLILLKENRIGVDMIEISYGKDMLIVQCTWNNANISNPFTTGKNYAIFAKSHQRNAAYYNYGFDADLSNNKEMKRNYTKRSSGELCVQVRWNEDASDDSSGLMQVKNLATGRVQPPTKTTHIERLTYFRWNHLDAGEYEFTLRFDERQPSWGIDLCKDDDGTKIWRTWRSTPKVITKCQIYVGAPYEFSAGPSSPPDATLKPDWTLEQWAYVCEQLGILPNDTEVQIKFCNFYGCNFSKCPHLQHDPSYLFDFATENSRKDNESYSFFGFWWLRKRTAHYSDY